MNTYHRVIYPNPRNRGKIHAPARSSPEKNLEYPPVNPRADSIKSKIPVDKGGCARGGYGKLSNQGKTLTGRRCLKHPSPGGLGFRGRPGPAEGGATSSIGRGPVILAKETAGLRVGMPRLARQRHRLSVHQSAS
ncbi:hypothetical protein KM043_002479 [Ampulex compressa]|nr:hypothetical protein KM043_002479 [Ampulex compressa]